MQVEIRPTELSEYKKTESLMREAFWNHYSPGCSKHYLVHVMRNHPTFIRELDFVAIVDGKIVGNVVYLKSVIKADDGMTHEVLSLGPIAVYPDYQRKGIGKAMIDHTRDLARQMGFKAILCTFVSLEREKTKTIIIHIAVMDWKNILVIVFAAITAGILTPKITPHILRWLKKMRIIKEEN